LANDLPDHFGGPDRPIAREYVCVCVCVSELVKQTTFDLDIWLAGSRSNVEIIDSSFKVTGGKCR